MEPLGCHPRVRVARPTDPRRLWFTSPPAASAVTQPSCLTCHQPVSTNIADLPASVRLRIDPEALQITDSELTVLKSYPYHQIPCWGHTRDAFQFRTFSGGTEVETVVVGTTKGVQLEAVIMNTVRALMQKMKDKGIPDVQFQQLVTLLGEDPDQAMAKVKQVAATREFDIKQATRLVATVGELSPFDKIEAAVLMYPTIMNKDSFGLVLNEFTDPADRDNVCHRLGITVGEDGSITEHGKTNVARQKPST